MKKVFESEFKAIEFAKKVKGLVNQSYLPNYNSVDVIWIVEYKEEEDGNNI